eukprot:7176065-Prymnesium_polylepis.1
MRSGVSKWGGPISRDTQDRRHCVGGLGHGAQRSMGKSAQVASSPPEQERGQLGSGAYFSYNGSESWVPVDCPPWHIPRREYVANRGFDPYAGSYTFCPVRHPFARAVSN